MITPEDEIKERLGLECEQGSYIYITNDHECATLDGVFSASDLRKIADELDRLSKGHD